MKCSGILYKVRFPEIMDGPIRSTVTAVSPEVLSAFPALAATRSGSDRAAAQSLRDGLAPTSGDDHGPIGTADFGLARSTLVAGASSRAWLVPSGDQVCTVLEDPAGGYGASCATPLGAAAGRGWVALGPAPGSSATPVTIAVPVPSGTAAPIIERGDGSTTTLSMHGGIAAAVLVVGKGDQLHIGSSKVSLEPISHPAP
jgi:hypothetical protein